jgi:hypothetical protein
MLPLRPEGEGGRGDEGDISFIFYELQKVTPKTFICEKSAIFHG